ncbi:hypothetical protein FKM82_014318 [Ascaphus truei]
MEQSFSVSSLKKLTAMPDHTDVSLNPEERVRALSKLGCNITINDDITPRRYFRSGVEMERMADVYLDEGNLENAFVLYNKFITLFVEKLPGHRDYQQCEIPEKQDILKKLKDVAFPRTDDLKKDLLKKYSLEYQEHMQGINKMKAEGRKKLEQQQLVEAEKKRVAQIRRQQVETEQFSYFEDQLRKQAVARGHVNNKESFKVSEQIDGSMSSCISTPKTNSSGTVFSGETVKNDAAMYAGQSPPVNRALKPAATLSAVQNEIVEGLRLVVLPRDLSHKFLQLADANTARGIETCGILCGILTHPTQTAFLSSVDLHTHCSYQLMLPEAIAIVCSPKHNDTGIFRLTNAGMLEVSVCKKKGFHPHSKDPRQFNTCRHVIVKDAKIAVLDLR